jgi:acyl carrier protein
MKTPYKQEDVLEASCAIIADILGCEPEEVNPDSSLGDDLGADSLSFVEISFGLGKHFGVALPNKSIIDHAAEQTGNEALFVAPDGGLTEQGSFLLENSFFGFDKDQIGKGMKRHAVMGATTPRNWANSVFHILGELPDACPDCGHHSAILKPNRAIACGQCGAALKPRNGDEVLAAYVSKLLSQAMALAA